MKLNSNKINSNHSPTSKLNPLNNKIMNNSTNTVRSASSQSQVSRRSFRVLVKNRITHQNAEPQAEKSPSKLVNVRSSLENFQQAKNNLKKYIRNMKASSKQGNYDSKQNTNRSSSSYLDNSNKIVKSGRQGLVSSRKQLKEDNSNTRAFVNTFMNPVQNKASLEESSKREQNVGKYLNQEITPISHQDGRSRSVNQSRQQPIAHKLPILKSALQQYSQPQNQTFYSHQNLHLYQTSSRNRLSQLQQKIQSLLEQKLKILSSTDNFSPLQKQNRTAFKLLEKQMDRILSQIRRIKENQSSLNRNNIQHELIEKDIQINRNIEMLEKKVKILERLIAEKIFEADNLKNQYLMKMKQFHQRNKSEMPHSRNSKSSTFYRQANQLHLSTFKPNKYHKGPIIQNDPTTNKAHFKTPMKSYYISPNKHDFYNSNTLTQPLPRSTYNRQYLVYGALPNQLIRVKSTQKDHMIFANNMSASQQKHQGSTYKEDFIGKKEKDPVNFKELDAYKDKFKNIQVNYGKERNVEKINNSQSVIDYYDEGRHRCNTENPQTTLPSLQHSGSKKSNLKYKRQEPSRPTLQSLNQTQKRISMIEQQTIQKHQLFHQRIKSEIKHKNVYDQKYKFKSELIKQKIKKYTDSTNQRNQRMRAHQTLAY